MRIPVTKMPAVSVGEGCGVEVGRTTGRGVEVLVVRTEAAGDTVGEPLIDNAVAGAMGERSGVAASVAPCGNAAVSVAMEAGGMVITVADAGVGTAVAVPDPAAETIIPNETVVGAGGMTGVAVGTGAVEQPTPDRASARSRQSTSLLIGDSRDYTPVV